MPNWNLSYLVSFFCQTYFGPSGPMNCKQNLDGQLWKTCWDQTRKIRHPGRFFGQAYVGMSYPSGHKNFHCNGDGHPLKNVGTKWKKCSILFHFVWAPILAHLGPWFAYKNMLGIFCQPDGAKQKSKASNCFFQAFLFQATHAKWKFILSCSFFFETSFELSWAIFFETNLDRHVLKRCSDQAPQQSIW